MLLLIAVSVLLLVMAVAKAGGPAEIISSTPASYWKLFQPIGHPDFPWLAILLGYPIMGIWFWCTDQSMVQSVLGAKDLRQGQKGANFVAWLKLIDIPLFIIPGILAFILLPGLQNSTDSYMKLVEHVLPTGLIGLVVVVMTASLISTIGSALNSLSAVFTMDIYLKYFNQNADIKRIRGVGRLTVLAGALIAVFLAIGITKIQGLSFFNIFQSVLGFIAPPMSVAFLFAVLWKRTSREAVNLVLSLGTLFSLGTGILYYNKLILNGVHFLYVSFLIFILLSFFVIIYSIFRKKEIMQDENLPVFESIRPGKKVIVAWSLLVLVMLVMYLIFN
jgi:SSS family solute:Na+ symporter